MVDVANAYRQCEQVIKYHSKTFYKAFSLLPEHKRKAVWAVYAFCRIVDDIVDEGSAPHEELAFFEKEFHLFLNGKIPQGNYHFMWVALHDSFTHYDLNKDAFLDMIIGQRMDLVKTRYNTVEEVLTYSYHVASSVGLMLLPILAPNKVEELREGAIALGLGMQLTNILRDIGDDLARDRIYLPRDLMDRYQYSEQNLQKGLMNQNFINLWEHLAKEAEQHYKKAMETMNEYPIYSRTPVKASAVLYGEILSKIRKKQYKVFDEKQYVSNEEKSIILSRISG
ncbi:phytoene/squalene synthase family protein [Metabacillus litoralis]|uniref:phytoene/squalene synthase family protein n=1 Tax=Metabacillus litoralis TaxID=152268 RepID=UPI001CFF4973|nr:phytoene/squalene synthase family protein [Metabacillus litoralis]